MRPRRGGRPRPRTAGPHRTIARPEGERPGAGSRCACCRGPRSRLESGDAGGGVACWRSRRAARTQRASESQSKRILPSQGGYGARARPTEVIDGPAVSDRVHMSVFRAWARAHPAKSNDSWKVRPNLGSLVDKTFLGLNEQLSLGRLTFKGGRPEIALALIEDRNFNGSNAFLAERTDWTETPSYRGGFQP